MSTVAHAVGRFVDMRRGEESALARSASALFLMVAAHTALETARDALLLRHFPARNFGVVYIAVALVALPVTAVSARFCARIGVRTTMVLGLIATSSALAGLFLIPTSPGSVLAVYVVSGVFNSAVLPLFWNLLGGVFTATQGRRLLSPVAAAGTLGAASGAGAAAGLLRVLPVSALLLVAASLALAATLVLPLSERSSSSGAQEPGPGTTPKGGGLLSEPFLRRAALLVAASSAVVIVLDFYFKWTVARSVPPERVASFIARYYALLSGIALVAQLVGSQALVRRHGVAWTILLTPLLVVIGTVLVLLSGGAVLLVLVAKGLDETLRQSVYRTTLELAYLPLPASTRTRAKPLIDGALVRVVQGSVGVLMLAGGAGGRLSSKSLALVTFGAAALWFLAAWAIQKPYIALLRRAVMGGAVGQATENDPLDLESAEALIGHLSSDDALTVVGAMNALARRSRARLIPALILLHPDDTVLTRALAILGDSDRKDWIPRGRKLLSDARGVVRMAAARALGAHGELDARDLSTDGSPTVRGYAALHAALENEREEPTQNPWIAGILGRTSPEGEDERLGLLSAIADLPENERLVPLLASLADYHWSSPNGTVELARAATAQRAVTLVPMLISRLTVRDGRESVRTALLSFGSTALDALGVTLSDGASSRALRFHVPNTVARFGTKPAAELLLATIERDLDGLVRYKAIRALGRLVAERHLKVDRVRIERLALENLLEHFRLLGLRLSLGPVSKGSATSIRPDPTARILIGLLDDKLRQSLERTFRLLKIAHPEEDIHRVHVAYLSDDKRARANAVEFLDALLRKRDQVRLGRLLRIIGEEPSLDEAVVRASGLAAQSPPASRQDALARLERDEDPTLAALAELHVAAISGKPSRVIIGSPERAPVELGVQARPELEASNDA